MTYPRKDKKKYPERFLKKCLDCILLLRSIAFMKDKKKTELSGSVKIETTVYKEVSDYCKEHGLKVTFFVTEAAKEKLQKEKK